MKQKPTKKCENGVQLRPASIEEAGLFYSELDQKQDEALGTVGHIRMDFGSGGREFWHTWWPHNEDRFNTLEFKEELQAIVDTLRANGPLKDLASMSNYCHKNGGTITEDSRSFGYVAETDHYRYCLRCTPTPGDYQGYLYCYDKRQQEMAQKDKIVGRVTFADGTAQEFTDPHQYLQTILRKKRLSLRIANITTVSLWGQMNRAPRATLTNEVPTVLESPSDKMWRAVIQDTSFITSALMENFMSSRRPSICCPSSPCIRMTGNPTAMWPAAEHLRFL